MTNLKHRRLMAELSQAELSKAAGIARVTYNNIETGRQEPTLDTMIKIARALECTVNDLIGEHKE